MSEFHQPHPGHTATTTLLEKYYATRKKLSTIYDHIFIVTNQGDKYYCIKQEVEPTTHILLFRLHGWRCEIRS